MISFKGSYRFKLSGILEIVNRHFEAALAGYGLAPKHYGVLMAVREYPEMTQAEAAALLNVDRSSMGKFVDLLEEKGFLVRKKRSADRRVYCLALTPDGEAAAVTLWEIMRQSERQAVAHLSEKEVRTFERLVDKILNDNI